MSVLVTGAAGLVGTHLLPLLGPTTSAVCRSHPSNPIARWIEHDLTTGAPPIPDGTSAIVHLAQSRRFRDFPSQAADIYSTNVASTAALLEAAASRGVEHFVLASSGAVYRPSKTPLIESSEILEPPASFYAATKRSAELLCGAYRDLMSITILRFFFVYGPSQEPSMLVPRLVDRVRSGEPIQLQGVDGMRFNPIHASDAARAAEAALGLDGFNVINVGGPRSITLREAVIQIGSALGKDPAIEVVDGQPDDFVTDLGLMKGRLVVPDVDPVDGLNEMCSNPQ